MDYDFDDYEDDENEAEYTYDYEADWLDCGMVNDKRMCLDAGSEHCSFWCPHHRMAFDRNADELPNPPDYLYEDDSVVYGDNDDVPF